MHDYKMLLPAVTDIAVQAGQAILEIYRSDFDVEHKDDDSPLTQADLASHRVITQCLADLTPDLPLLSEEGADIAFEQRRQWQSYWLIDPLDGTREFVKKNGEFTVNIALIENGDPTLGVVHAPDMDMTWYAAPEEGAFKQHNEKTQRITTTKTDRDKPRVLVSKSHRGEEVDVLLGKLPDYEAVSVGSSLKFCVIAQGEADFYPRLGPTSEWDTAAGHAVLNAAGGQVLEIDGATLRYNQKDSVLNPHFLALGDRHFNWRDYL